MKTNQLLAFAAGLLTFGNVWASDIVWSVQDNTSSDADVRTEGRCLYAYTHAQSRCIVNGVEFSRFDKTKVSDIAGDILFDIVFDAADVFRPAGDWQGSADYLRVLNGGWYYSNGYQGRVYPLTFNGLTAGRRYLIQIWVCDVRHTDRSGHTIQIGTQKSNKYANGAGVNFTGTFTATASSETVDVTFNNEAVINAFQVRCLDEAKIDWSVLPTSGESDVRTDGKLVYAYKSGSAIRVNGVSFAAAAGGVTDWDGNVTFSAKIGSTHTDFCWSSGTVPTGAYSYSSAYRDLVKCGFYSELKPYRRRDVTLHGLVPGRHYLVQMWNVDNRSDYSNRSILYDNTVCASNSYDRTAYGHGSYVVGTFTAKTTDQTIGTYGRALSSFSDTQEMIGPMQLRCLDDEENGFVAGTTQADGSVDTRGSAVYAYALTATSVSGVDFRAFVALGDQYGDFVFVTNGIVRANFSATSRAFLTSSTVSVSPAVTNLLAGGLYQDDGFEMNQIWLKRLVPGRRYLVQAWFADTRDNGLSKVVEFGGASARYLVRDTMPLGQYVTGTFRATNSTHAVLMRNTNMQINALQVRELGTPFASTAEWTVANTQQGEASVLTEGKILYAFAPKAYTLDNGVRFAQAAANSAVWGAGDITLDQAFGASYNAYGTNGQTGPIADLLNNGWYQPNTPGLSDRFDFTLHHLIPGHVYVAQLYVSDLRSTSLGGRRIYIYDKSGFYGLDNAPYGTTCTARFTASGDSYSFQVRYSGVGSSQLNAIQVRDLGACGAVWAGGAEGTWTTDGAGWTKDGVSQAGTTLWGAGSAEVASVTNDATLTLGEDVAAQVVSGSGNLTIGAVGTDERLSVASEISAPTATVNAAWGASRIDKTVSGRLVLAGDCSRLVFVNVFDGLLVLDGHTSCALDVTLQAPGRLGFSRMTEIAFHTLKGDGALAGPGGVAISDGSTFTVPSTLTSVDGFAWGLSNGSTLALQDGADASRVSVSIDDPDSYCGKLAVKALGAVTGKPKFVFPRKGFKGTWDAALSGWKVVSSGFMVIVR